MEIRHRIEQADAGKKAVVEIQNLGENIAFLIELKIVGKESGEVVLPVFWDENYLSLLPGEQRTVSAVFRLEGDVRLEVGGWNIG